MAVGQKRLGWLKRNSVVMTDATPTPVLSWTPDLGAVYIVQASVIGVATGGDKVAVRQLVEVARSGGGTVVTLMGTPKRSDTGSAGWVVAFAESGGALVCTVTGEIGHSIRWTPVFRCLDGVLEML